MQSVIVALSVVYLLSEAFDSVLRWLLNFLGAAGVIYLRDYLLILIVLGCCYTLARTQRNLLPVLWLFAVLVASTCVSLASDLGPSQILFGLKVWLPFVCGYFLAEAGMLQALDRPRAWMAVWAALCIGIGINAFVHYPWEGLIVKVGGIAISANREWSAGDVRRLSGFSRSSYDGAIMVTVLFIYLVSTCKSLLGRFALTLVTFVAVILTTSKGIVGALIGVCLMLPVISSIDRENSRRKWIAEAGLILIAIVAVTVPLISVQIPFPKLNSHSGSYWLFASFLDRAWNTWPIALKLLSGWQLITGRGIGGIGVAQELFEPGRANSADSFFIYLYVTAGVFGAALYSYIAVAASKLALSKARSRMAFLLLFYFFAYGLVANMIESAINALLLGALASFLMLGAPQRTRVGRALRSRAPQSGVPTGLQIP